MEIICTKCGTTLVTDFLEDSTCPQCQKCYHWTKELKEDRSGFIISIIWDNDK